MKKNDLFSILIVFFSLTLWVYSGYAQTVDTDQEVEVFQIDNQNNDYKTKISINDTSEYKLKYLPDSPELLEKFQSLSQQEQDAFYQKRYEILKPIILGLDTKNKKYLIGKVLVIKNKLVRVFKKKSEIKDLGEVDNLAKDKIQEFVDKIDLLLWDSSLVLANANQKGKSIALTTMFGAGVKDSGYIFGLSIGIGLYKDLASGKTKVEFFYTKDKFSKAHSYALPTFIGIRVNWLSLRNSTDFARMFTEVKGKGYSLPLWLPKVYLSPSSFEIASRFGVDLFDLLVPMQTAAQYYEVEWKRHSFQKNFSSCARFYMGSGG